MAESNEESLSISVTSLAGDGINLRIPGSTMGWELLAKILAQMPSKPGTRACLQHAMKELDMKKSLTEQGLDSVGEIYLSLVYARVNVQAAWKCIFSGQLDDDALAGITEVHGLEKVLKAPESVEVLTIVGHPPLHRLLFMEVPQPFPSHQLHLPRQLRRLTLDQISISKWSELTWPLKLEELTFGDTYNCPLHEAPKGGRFFFCAGNLLMLKLDLENVVGGFGCMILVVFDFSYLFLYASIYLHTNGYYAILFAAMKFSAMSCDVMQPNVWNGTGSCGIAWHYIVLVLSRLVLYCHVLY